MTESLELRQLAKHDGVAQMDVRVVGSTPNLTRKGLPSARARAS